MKPLIFMLITELDAGGAERIVYDLVTHFTRYTPVVVALEGSGHYAEKLAQAGIEVINLAARHHRDLGVLRRLRKLLVLRRPALLHCHLIHATVIGRLAAWGTGVPVLSTCHIVERRPVGWHFWANRWTARLGVGETCVSEAVRDFQIEKTQLPPDFFQVIYNGIDLTRFDHLPPRLVARAAYGMEGHDMWIGYLGRFEKQKGVDVLLSAMTLPALERVRLLLGGFGVEEEALRAQAAPFHDWVRFAGFQEDAARFLSACDIVVMPSRWEGFGLVAAEALACGKPLVTTTVDALPEILSHEETALLVPPDDPQALADAIRRLIDDAPLRHKLATNGPAAAQRFSLPAMVHAYESCYDRLLA